MPDAQLTWIEVDSSNIHSVAFHEPKGVIAVRFNNGTLYSYQDATTEMFSGLVGAESVGKYLFRVVKALAPYTKWNDEAELTNFLNL